MPDEDPEKLADELDQQADQLERHSSKLGQHVAEARQAWQRKRRDENVPGAPPPNDDERPGGAESESPSKAPH